jgi:thiamine pyrophosphokinase
MARFVILLGGDLVLTPRLQDQVSGARAIAADSGMAHAELLGLDVELWVGDFDSTGRELAARYATVERQTYSPDKSATDGELAVAEALRRGATEIVFIGAFGGQSDHMLGHAGLALRLAKDGYETFLTSARFSIIPFMELKGLDLENVRWPLVARDVPLGSTLTISNVALGPVTIGLRGGYGLAVAYPGGPAL